MSTICDALRSIVGTEHVRAGTEVHGDDTHDESLTGAAVAPLAVVRPATTHQVSAILTYCAKERVEVVARGSGTGLSGGARPVDGGIVVCFDRMQRIIEVDTDNHVAVVQPGVTLRQLDDALRPYGLVYPVYPGEMSASLGGNVATNAGGMRAVRYGVTRHHVLGLELVLAGGEVLRSGGKYVKSSSGYDLTQLVIGSEGTLALVTEVTVKLVPRLDHTSTLLAPFRTLEEVAGAIGPTLGSGVGPLIFEYVDALAMRGILQASGIELGIPEAVAQSTSAYLVVVLESARGDRLEEDVASTAETLAAQGALDVYVLPPAAGAQLIAARERAFFVSKSHGANDVVDTVVPRAAIPAFLRDAARVAAQNGALLSGCGHVGDGNVHLSVFQPDDARRQELLFALFAAAAAHGGAVSGEHGIGTDKQRYYLALEDPGKVALMRRIKAAFDPHGILGPRRLVDDGTPLEAATAEAAPTAASGASR